MYTLNNNDPVSITMRVLEKIGLPI